MKKYEFADSECEKCSSETTPGDGEKTKKKVTMNVNNTQTTTAEDGDGGEGHKEENGGTAGGCKGRILCVSAAKTNGR